MMRAAMFSTLLLLAACEGADAPAGDEARQAAPPGGYTMEIRAGEAEQTYLVIAPDGRTVGARSAEGVSALMDGERARSLAASTPPQGEETPDVMSLRLPGFEMSVGGSESGANGENGRVNIAIGGGDGQRIEVRADEGGPGDADDRAYVRITGADETAVREFIAEADKLSPSVQAQMLAELGISESAAQ
ncbi:MAG: hypothetical protein K2P58_05635 [Hyphomonadaceae bacterium]|nr:hypothetical protein [Hyphomonadaceae bacterium]